MNLLEIICEELGVEIGKEWKNDAGDTFKITQDGLFYKWAIYEWEECDSSDYRRLLTGELKPVWKPELGEIYYIPAFHFDESSRYYWFDWNASNIDKWHLNNQLVCKTKEEAINMTNKILEVVKEED